MGQRIQDPPYEILCLQRFGIQLPPSCARQFQDRVDLIVHSDDR